MNTQNPEIQESNHPGFRVRAQKNLMHAGVVSFVMGTGLLLLPFKYEEQAISPDASTELAYSSAPLEEEIAWVKVDKIHEGFTLQALGGVLVAASLGIKRYAGRRHSTTQPLEQPVIPQQAA